MNHKLFVLFVLALCAAVVGCSPSVTPTEEVIPAFDVTPYLGVINSTCTNAATSVYGEPHPLLQAYISTCESELRSQVAEHTRWAESGSLPPVWANAIANLWGSANAPTVARILAAMQVTRYTLEDQGLMMKDPAEVREDPWGELNGVVINTAPYPWVGQVESGGNLWSTLALICDKYTRSIDTCNEGSELWLSQTGNVAIFGKQALDYLSAVPGLPVMQPGDTVQFANEVTIRQIIQNVGSLIVVETEENSRQDGYTPILRVTYPDGTILRQHFNYGTQTWEIVP